VFRSPATPLRSRILAALAVAVLAVLWFGNLEIRDLVDPDEGRYAEIPREMAVSGDWVTPRLNGLKYFEKPPLQYWITASSYLAFGVEEWVARLWPALAGLGGIVLAAFASARIYDRRTGFMTALLLGGMVQYVIFAHILTLDMSETFFLSVTVLGIAIAQRDEATAAERRWWMLAAWAAAACAVLAKGLIGIVLPVATVGIYVLWQRDWRLVSRLHAGTGLLLFLLVCVPWFALVSARNPEFAQFFFWHEHVERFLKPGHRRPGAWWYYIPIVALGTMPVFGLVLATVRRWWSVEASAAFQPGRFLALWVTVVLLFFSASSSKLPGYILPCFPALAVLVARHLRDVAPRLEAAALGVWAPALGVLAWVTAHLTDHEGAVNFPYFFANYMPWLESALGLLALALMAGAAVAWQGRRVAALVIASAGSLAAVTVGMTGEVAWSEIYSTEQAYYKVVGDIADADPRVPFYSVRMFDYSLAFALERPVVLVEHRDELDLGLQAEPEKGIATLAQFESIWRAANDGFAVMRPDTYTVLLANGLPMHVLAEDPRHVIVRRRPHSGAQTLPDRLDEAWAF
jgi:4-amino-4-deoxy-L-arabinose transferase-like glycosyltransferase